MSASDSHGARGSGQASFLWILAIIMASIAIGLWFWHGPPSTAPPVPAPAASEVPAPATGPTRSVGAARSYREGRNGRASAVAAAEVTAALAK